MKEYKILFDFLSVPGLGNVLYVSLVITLHLASVSILKSMSFPPV